MTINRQLVLARRPSGLLGDDDLEFVNGEIPTISDGEALVRTQYLGFDATVRSWLNGSDGYLPAVEIGEPVRGSGVGRVIESRCESRPVGSLVTTLTGWQDYSVVRDDFFSTAFAPDEDPLLLLALHGSPGPTAYFGLVEIGRPNPGETVVVSAAAGSTGSLVGQIAKIYGCRVVGIAGSDEKCRWLTNELGFDAAINRHDDDLREQLRAHCPDRIDIYFDNVGGPLLDIVLRGLADRGRVVLCGAIASYNDEHRPPGPANYQNLISRRGRMEGFLSLDYIGRYPEAMEHILGWVADGNLRWHADVLNGLERSVDGLNALFTGTNRGKSCVWVYDEANDRIVEPESP
jgi:NADPH-dependent curcumin reductase CurA